MVQNQSLKKLRMEIAEAKRDIGKRKKFAKTVTEKKQLKRELFLLKNPKKVAFFKRGKAGLAKTGTTVGKGLLKQAKLIQDQQERERRLDAARSQRPKKIKVRKSKEKKRSISDGIFGNLDF